MEKLLPVFDGVDLSETGRMAEAFNKNREVFDSNPEIIKQLGEGWEALQDSCDEQTALDAETKVRIKALTPSQFLPLIRQAEQLIIDNQENAIVVYWSRQAAARLLPRADSYRRLISIAASVSIFSEDNHDPPDEFCFIVLSRGLSLALYGQQVL